MDFYLILSYDGTDFNGWQAQRKESLRTVQETAERAAAEIFGKPVRITASGRTDAGVHARCQVCSLSADTTIPPERLADCFNTLLPRDVRAVGSGAAPEGFDACRQAKRKTYVYSLYHAVRDDPLRERYGVRAEPGLDEGLLREAAAPMVGEHDFRAFCASNSSALTTVRTVYSVDIRRERSLFGEETHIFVTGNGFLYNMVRTMAGTLLEAARGRIAPGDVKRAVETGDRSLVGRTMPARGLCLYSVEYAALQISPKFLN